MQEEKGHCCPKGSWPALVVDYQPKGTWIPIPDSSCYHVGDATSDKILILIEDIFGAESARHRSVADTFAELGYNVYMPKILITPYEGPMELGLIMANITSQDWARMEARFKGLLELINEKGPKQFFAGAFCWGVWAGFKFASKFDGFKSFVGFHPSLGLCGAFGENEKELVESVKCPAFFLPASNDPANIKEGGEWVQILQQKFGEDKAGTKSFP